MEGFNDLIEDIQKQGGELMWITKKKQFLENTQKDSKSRRTPDQLKQDVLQSARLKHCADQLVANDPTITHESIVSESKKILDEMAHQFDLKYVRLLGYALIKVFTKIYKHIYYNADICSNLQVLKQYPTIFLPLHRSYMDFLLVSIICFHKNIQLPAVATGQDFLGLSFLSQVIRHTGAFFIRRSFGSDQLYWALFNEYVQQHLLNCDRPLEFFIEGMRSRTSKSLRPKLGMLSSCIEPYLKGHRLEDIYLVPISLTYERLLEELLYSNELLGIPKPKESVSGLVKARSILNQSFGTIFINFSRPISVREMMHHLSGPKLTNTLMPSFVFELSADQYKSIESLSFVVLIEMQKQQIIQPISLIATCILYSNDYSINLDKLSAQVSALKRLLNNLGAKVYWPLNDTDQSEFDKVKNLCIDNLISHLNLFNTVNNVVSVRQPNDLNAKNSLLENASIYLAVCSYKNQLVNFLVRISFVCNCLLAANSSNILGLSKRNDETVFEAYRFLTVLFNREFIFHEGDERKDLNDAISYLLHTNLIRLNGDSYELVKFNLKHFLFIASMFQSVQKNYLEIYSNLNSINKFDNEKKIVNLVQEKIFEKISNKSCANDYEVLSLNLISNSILTLRQFNIMKKSETFFEIDSTMLTALIFNKLAYLIERNNNRLSSLHDFDLNQTYDAIHYVSSVNCENKSKL